MAASTDDKSPRRTPTMGETMNRINAERIARTGQEGMYTQSNRELIGDPNKAFQNTRQAYNTAASEATGLMKDREPLAAIDRVIRGAGDVARGYGADVAGGSRQIARAVAGAPLLPAPGPVSQLAAASAQPARPVAAPTPAPAPTSPAPGVAPAATQGPPEGLPPGYTVSKTSSPDIQRVDGGSSPLFTNIDPAQSIQQMAGGTVNSMPAASFRSGGPGASQELAAARQAAAARGDFGSLQTSYQQNGGTWMGETAQQSQNKALMAQAQALLTGKSRSGKAEGSRIIQSLMEGERTSADKALDRQSEAPAREGQVIQNEQRTLELDLTRKAMAGDKDAMVQLQALSGKSPDNQRLKMFSDLMGEYMKASSQAAVTGATLPPFADYIGQFLPLIEGAGAAPAAVPGASAGSVSAGKAVPPPNETRGTYQGKTGVVRNGKFIPD